MTSLNATVRDRILAAMPAASFNPPATREMIDAAQTTLGVTFPRWLESIYLACDGFYGPTSVQYLYPLTGPDSVIELTRFLRGEWQLSWLDESAIFSDNGGDGSNTVHWGIRNRELIEWCYGHDGEFKTLKEGFIDVLVREQALWDEIDPS